VWRTQWRRDGVRGNCPGRQRELTPKEGGRNFILVPAKGRHRRSQGCRGCMCTCQLTMCTPKLRRHQHLFGSKSIKSAKQARKKGRSVTPAEKIPATPMGGGGRHTVFWVGHGPPKNFFGWAIMHLAHPKNAGAK
jgi:hypothetical protein